MINLFGKHSSNKHKSSENNTTMFVAPLETKASKANTKFVENVNNLSTNNYITTYSTADVVFSCVGYASDIASQVELKLYSKKNGELTPIKDDKLLNWIENPNGFQHISDLIYVYMQSYLLAGNAYITFEKIGGRFESWILNPVKTNIVPDSRKYIKGYIYDDQISFKPTEVIHFKNSFLGSEYYGQSFLASLVDPLLIEGYGIDDLKTFYDNSLIAHGIFTSEYGLSEKQIKALRTQFDALYGKGGSHRHGHLILDNNMKYSSIKMSPKDAMLLDALKISEDRIYKVFRLHKNLIGGETSSVNGTELREYKKIFVNNFIKPILHRMSKVFESFLRRTLKDSSLVVLIDYSNIAEVSDLFETRIDSVRTGIASGIISLNEARMLLALDKIDGKYTDALLSASYLHGTEPIDMVSGETLRLSPTNQQPGVNGSDSPSGGTTNQQGRN